MSSQTTTKQSDEKSQKCRGRRHQMGTKVALSMMTVASSNRDRGQMGGKSPFVDGGNLQCMAGEHL